MFVPAPADLPLPFLLLKAKGLTFIKTLKIQISVKLIKGNLDVLWKIKKTHTEYLINDIKLRTVELII